jgi:glycosyltransferase involved in cell wall biosynthesis
VRPSEQLFQSVLHINEKGGRFGGTEGYIHGFAEICAHHGISSYLIYDKVCGEFSKNLTYLWVPGLGKRKAITDAPERTAEIVCRVRPDVVYLHNIFDGEIVHALGRLERSLSLLWYVHDHYPTCLTELRSRKSADGMVCELPLSERCLEEIQKGNCLKRYADREYTHSDVMTRMDLLESAQSADIIVVVSEYMEKVLVSNLPQLNSKIKVLPRQIRKPTPHRPARQSPMLRLAYSGRITREKGLHVALRALMLLPEDVDIEFSIAGVIENAPYWEECLELIEQVKRVKSHFKIDYLGFLPYQVTDELYSQIDILIVPSIWAEPLGAVAAEALSHKAAVIVSDAGGISTWVKHLETGLLVEPDNPAAIASAIERLSGNRELLRMLAEKGQSLIHTQFTAERHFEVLSQEIRGISRNSN